MNAKTDSPARQVLRNMDSAIANRDWDAARSVLDTVLSIEPTAVRADILNQLLITPGHVLHQEVVREIQLLRHPSSVPYIQQVLANGFEMFEYACSESGAIAKWFSHALADINTPEALAVIDAFAGAKDAGVANEMGYRRKRLLKEA